MPRTGLRGFLPSIGRLARYAEPSQEAVAAAERVAVGAEAAEDVIVRVDSGVVEGSEISMFYDPMIAKLVTHAPDRATAITAMRARARRLRDPRNQPQHRFPQRRHGPRALSRGPALDRFHRRGIPRWLPGPSARYRGEGPSARPRRQAAAPGRPARRLGRRPGARFPLRARPRLGRCRARRHPAPDHPGRDRRRHLDQGDRGRGGGPTPGRGRLDARAEPPTDRDRRPAHDGADRAPGFLVAPRATAAPISTF